jgi:hypothetical protein
MDSSHKAPRWYKVLLLGFFWLTFAMYLIAWAVSALVPENPDGSVSLPYRVLVTVAVMLTGVTLMAAVFGSTYVGWFWVLGYSRKVTRSRQPKLFWTIIVTLELLAAGVVVFGLWCGLNVP